MPTRFSALLVGREEVPPVFTFANGRAFFQLSPDQQQLTYQLSVNRLQAFTEAHIHLGMRGEIGPIVVFLFGPVSPGITVNTGVVRGVITEDNLVGPLAGQPLSMLVEEMRRGNTYVNAHTERYPEGEIRGQIRPSIF